VDDGVPPRHPTGNRVVVAGRARGVGAVAVAIEGARTEHAQRTLWTAHDPMADETRGTRAHPPFENETLRSHAPRNSKATASRERAMHVHANPLMQATL
jgi:hypothetical protein